MVRNKNVARKVVGRIMGTANRAVEHDKVLVAEHCRTSVGHCRT